MCLLVGKGCSPTERLMESRAQLVWDTASYITLTTRRGIQRPLEGLESDG